MVFLLVNLKTLKNQLSDKKKMQQLALTCLDVRERLKELLEILPELMEDSTKNSKKATSAENTVRKHQHKQKEVALLAV